MWTLNQGDFGVESLVVSDWLAADCRRPVGWPPTRIACGDLDHARDCIAVNEGGIPDALRYSSVVIDNHPPGSRRVAVDGRAGP